MSVPYRVTPETLNKKSVCVFLTTKAVNMFRSLVFPHLIGYDFVQQKKSRSKNEFDLSNIGNRYFLFTRKNQEINSINKYKLICDNSSNFTPATLSQLAFQSLRTLFYSHFVSFVLYVRFKLGFLLLEETNQINPPLNN